MRASGESSDRLEWGGVAAPGRTPIGDLCAGQLFAVAELPGPGTRSAFRRHAKLLAQDMNHHLAVEAHVDSRSSPSKPIISHATLQIPPQPVAVRAATQSLLNADGRAPAAPASSCIPRPPGGEIVIAIMPPACAFYVRPRSSSRAARAMLASFPWPRTSARQYADSAPARSPFSSSTLPRLKAPTASRR